MNTILGGHITTGSRSGWGAIAPHLRGALSFLADAFVEMSPDAFKAWRCPPYEYAGYVDGDIMPGFDQLGEADMPAQAAYWWPKIEAAARAEEARLGVKFNAIKCTNEVGGNDPARLRALVAYERALMPLAEESGYRLLIGNFGTNGPHMPLWEEIAAPFIIEAARRGHIYSRHVYASDQPGGLPLLVKVLDDGSMLPGGDDQKRLFEELAYFRARGLHVPMILGETGFYAMPPLAHFMQQITLWDVLLSSVPEIGFASIFTWGEWGDANVEAASIELATWTRERPFTRWFPQFSEDAPPPSGKHKAIVVKLPQEVTADEWQQMAAYAHAYRHTMTASHDDALTVLRGGNADSYAKVFEPTRPSQRETIALIEAAGYRWEALTLEPEPEPPVSNPLDGLQLGAPFAVPFVRTSAFGVPRSYGLHEGVDYDILTAVSDSAEPVRALHDGVVTITNESAGYGKHVVIRGMNNGSAFYTWLCHLDTIDVVSGEQVTKGQPVGQIGSTGNSTGEHVHVNLQVPGFGLDGYILPHVVNPEPYIAASPTPPPPTGKPVNIRAYFEPVGDVGQFKVLAWLDGSRTQDQQLQRRPDGTIVEVKGNEHERWEFSGGEMRRWEDTSRGGGTSYTQHGARWLPETCEVGRWYRNDLRVTAYDANCGVISSVMTTDYLRINAVHDRWVSPFGIELGDVLEVEWRKSPTGATLEVYYYAPRLGLVAWGAGDVPETAVSELPQGRAPLPFVEWRCG